MALDESQFKISYDGPALANHEMEVRDLAPALLAIGELLEEANRALNGDQVKIRVNIKAPSEGSVQVVFSIFQDWLNQTKSLLNGDGVNAFINATEILTLLGVSGGGVINILKWLKNRPVKSVTKVEVDNFKIETEDGDIKIVNEQELKLFSILSIRKKFEAIIQKPLEREGVDKVIFRYGEEMQEVSKDEIVYFSAPALGEEIIDEKEYSENLQIVTVSFAEDAKWKFFDGSTAFFAEILDKDFLEKIQKNEKFFAKDDILNVQLKRIQSISNGVIKNSYTIIKVLNHRSAAIQIKLPFVN